MPNVNMHIFYVILIYMQILKVFLLIESLWKLVNPSDICISLALQDVHIMVLQNCLYLHSLNVQISLA